MYAKRSLSWSTLLLCVCLCLSVARSAFAVGEQNGRIEGTVTEAQTGAPIGGATVVLSGRALIGGPRSVTAGDDGRYEIVELPPGSYDLEFSYPGLKPVRRRAVVRLGETVPINVEWTPETAAAPEVTVVQEERHMTRPDTTQAGTVLSADTEARQATNRSYQGVLTQVAGVSDTGGGIQRGIPNIKGGNRLQNRYLVDGMDITDSTTNNFSTQVNFDSIGSVELITSGMEAQYNALGGVINLNTLSGGDELHIDTSLYINNESFSAPQFAGVQGYDHTRPFATDPTPPNATYQGNLSVSGPLIKQKLWLSFSFEYDYNARSTPVGAPLNVQHPARIQHSFFPRIKLTFAPRASDRVTLTANGDPAIVYNRDGTSGNSLLPPAETGQTQGGAFAVLQWDHFFSQNVNSNVQAGFNFNHVYVTPQGQLGSLEYGARDPRFSSLDYTYNAENRRYTNSFDGTSWYQGTELRHDRRYTAQLDPSLSFRGHLLGFHDVKIGLQNRFVFHHFFQHLPGWARYTNNSGQGLEGGLCQDPEYAVLVDPATGMQRPPGSGCTTSSLRIDQNDFANEQYAFSSGLFLQDRWKPLPRLTVLPGMRFDWGITRNGQGETVSNLFGLGPRLGFTFDITGDQKTIFSAYYGRSNDVAYLLPASRADVEAPAQQSRWDQSQQKFVFESQTGGGCGYQLDPAVGGDPSGGAGRSSCSAKKPVQIPGGGPPHTDEVSFGLVREFFKNSVAGVNYTYRRISNIWEAVETNAIWDPSGYRIIGYTNGRPERIFQYTTPDGNYRIYQGIDFTVESRPTPSWDFYAAYTLSWLYGPGVEEISTVNTGGSAFANPRQFRYYDGFLPEDQRHQLKLHASYEWKGLSLGVNFQYFTGYPTTKQFFNNFDGSSSNKRTPQGTEPGGPANSPTAISEFRIPDTFVVNARVSFDAYELIHQHVTLIADFFNLFNVDTPTSFTNTDGPNFGLANRGRQTPFRFQLGARYTY